MRLFAAVDPPADAIAHLEAAVGAHTDGLRRVPTEQWHLTTAFYGEVADDVAAELADRLSRAAARTPPMSLQIRGAGTFPKQSVGARVLWAGVDGDVAGLTRLAERCVAAGRRCGLTMEDRSYRPHLTLARARRDPVDLREAVAALSSYVGQPWPVTSLRLVKSTLGAHVTHEPLHEWPLPPPE
jgi:RNA 2',3'-cyclic 3'-phosphodiesterase